MGAFKGKADGFDLQEFWKHSIACGVTAKLLKERDDLKLDIGEDDPFMAGMVHDIGKQVLGFFFNEMFQMVSDEIRSKAGTMLEVEIDVLGLTHADIGQALASKWQLPDILSQVIGMHHKPASADSSVEMVRLIYISDICAKQVGFSLVEKPQEYTLDERVLEAIGMDSDQLNAIFKELEPTLRSQVNDTFSAIFK